ncbi:Leucine-rich repeat receptor-like protein kinase family protein [Quillaja saponaria]|uniref:non-specific serine/threonine protein kinase n=1 Tax=Quillaja saponaria TaxID=32244 RepID=A0AAD7L0W0_QUISA|nr:Leucine-rich repeat receptor-like protein kinase family protein [Quillaja saponaria]
MADKLRKLVAIAFSAAWLVFLDLCKITTGSTTEAEALLRWKETLPVQPILQNWVAAVKNNSSTAQNPCGWQGITCDPAGNVIEIHLAYNDLEVPQGSGNFSSLIVLNLAENNFSGQLPPHVCKGGKLQNFTATKNSFTGPIPVSLRNCQSLYRVRLEQNQLRGQLDQDFGVYPNLTYFDLSFNKVQGKLSPNWGASKKLTSLRVGGNSIVGRIPDEILQLRELVELDLSSNHLSGELPEQIGNLSTLSVLRMNNNKLSGPIPAGIGMLSNLQYLDLSMNLLRGSIPYQIGDGSKLQNLSKNYLNGTIPYQIGNLLALQGLLDLSYNSISGEIPTQLEKLTKLITSTLSHNNLSDSIPKSIKYMLSLSQVNLSYNRLEGPLPDANIFNSFRPEDFSNNNGLCGNTQGLQPCTSITGPGGRKKNHRTVIIVVSCLGSSLLVSMVLTGILVHLNKKRSRNTSKEDHTSKREDPFSIWYFSGKIVYEDILKATMNFNDRYCVGEGATGKVYRAEMPGGQVFAVKRLWSKIYNIEIEDTKSFKNEIAALTETRHRNIVKLHGKRKLS